MLTFLLSVAQAYSVLQYLYIGKALITKYKDVKE